MTNKIRKALICALTAIGLMLAVIAAVFLSACADDNGDNKIQPQAVTLTFMVGEETFAERTGLPDENVGAVAAPEADLGYIFTGWAKGSPFGTAADAPATFPEKSATYYAVFVEVPADETVLVFMNGNNLHAWRHGNAGESYEKVPNPVPATGFTFDGWAVGSSLNTVSELPAALPSKSLNFYAKFSQRVTGKHEYYDIIGGSDVIEVNGDVATLKRDNAENATGSYNSGTGYFRFEITESFTLEGVVQTGLNGFYYFKDLEQDTEYNEAFERGETVTFKDNDTMTYSDGENEVTGNFSIDPISGDFTFDSVENYFIFRLDRAAHTFTKVIGEERGYYVLEMENGYEFLLLDGLPLYSLDTNGKPVFVNNSGTAYSYNYNPATGRFLTRLTANYTLDNSVPDIYDYKQYKISLSEDYDTSCRITKCYKQYCGYDVSGNFVAADAFAGDFYDKLNVADPSADKLHLDGYGRGNFNDTIRGSYETVESPVYQMYSPSVGVEDYSEVFIKFIPDSSSHPEKYYRLESGSAGLVFMALDEMPRLIDCENLISDVYRDRIETFTNMAMYFYSDTAVYVWSYIYDSEYNLKLYDIADYGTIEDLGDGEYRYTSGPLSQTGSSGEVYLFTYDFKFNETGDKIICGNAFMEGDEKIADNAQFSLVSDKYGKLTYTDKTTGETHVMNKDEYTYYFEISEGAFAIYEFSFGKNDGVKIYMSNYNEDSRKYVNAQLIPYSDYSKLAYYLSVAQNGEYDEMALLKDDATGKYTKAFIKITYYDMGSYDEMHGWIAGNLTEADGVYTFTLIDEGNYIITNFGESFEYQEFEFKIDESSISENGCKFIHHDKYENAYTIDASTDTLTLDGYGKGTMTKQDVSAHINVTYKVDKGLLIVTEEGGEVHYYYFDESSQTTLHISDEEGGVYVYKFADDTLSFGTTAVFYGNGKVKYTTTENSYTGTYTTTGKEFQDLAYFGTTWKEFKLELENDDSSISEEDRHQTLYMALTRDVELVGGMKINVLIVRVSDPGEFKIAELDAAGNLKKDGDEVKVIATLSGNGYTMAAYVGAASAGGGYYSGEISRGAFLNDSSNPQKNFEFDPNGDCIYFTYYVNAVTQELDSMIFDKKMNGENEYWVRRPLQSGTFLSFTLGALDDTESIELDGYGNAKWTHSGTTTNGKYEAITGSGEYNLKFTAEGNGASFNFYTAIVQSDATYSNIMVKQTNNTIYTNAEKESLSLNETGEATYIDRYGIVYGGNYSFITQKLVSFQEHYDTYYGDLIIFNVAENDGAKTFNRNTDDFVIEDHVLLAYQGPSTVHNLVIPDGVTEIGPNVFRMLRSITSKKLDKFHIEPASIDFNDVEIIGHHAFYDIPGLFVNTLTADNVREIGDYAFYSHARDEYIYSINTIIMPNLEKVGAYAFYGCNQLTYGHVKTNKLKELGAYSFAHNMFADDEYYDDQGQLHVQHYTMTLDLTEMTLEDIKAIKIDPKAFYNTRTGIGDEFVPLDIYVATEEAKTELEKVLSALSTSSAQFLNDRRVVHVGNVPVESEPES